MTTWALLVKGTESEAHAAAKARGISCAFITYSGKARRPRADETVLLATEEHFEKIVKWYCEEGTAPFPPGTLLFYYEYK